MCVEGAAAAAAPAGCRVSRGALSFLAAAAAALQNRAAAAPLTHLPPTRDAAPETKTTNPAADQITSTSRPEGPTQEVVRLDAGAWELRPGSLDQIAREVRACVRDLDLDHDLVRFDRALVMCCSEDLPASPPASL